MVRIAVLLTCHNRKDITLKSISGLYNCSLHFFFDVFLVDDGSTDGTYIAVHSQYPNINIIKGNGNLFWNRGMRLAWSTAIEQKAYDGYIWLNDDVVLYDYALDELLTCAQTTFFKSIICGCLEDSGSFSYGGKDYKGNPILPNGDMLQITLLNGNCVFIPNNIVKKIGILDNRFWHHIGDYEYGLRVIHNGLKMYSTTRYIGKCKTNPKKEERRRKFGVSLPKRLNALYTSPFITNPINIFYYNRKYRKELHYNIFYPYIEFVMIHILMLFSDKLYSKIIYHLKNNK